MGFFINKLVKTFINLFKGNGYTKEKFIEFRKINEEKYTGFDNQKLKEAMQKADSFE